MLRPMSTKPSPCARLLRDLRARGWSYAQIGNVIGLRRSSVCDIERGRTVQPRPAVAERLRALHATGLTGPYNPNRRIHRETP